jgi:hypothetical protein
MTVTVINGTSNRTYISNVVINSGATWEYKTLTIPGDTAGTWAKDNTTGLYIRFTFGCGSSFQGTPGAWSGNYLFGTSTTTNFVAAANVCSITGLIVLPGIELPSSARAPYIMRPYDQELQTCKRYWQQIGGRVNQDILIEGYQLAGGYIGHTFALPVEMRATPTYTLAGAWNQGNAATATYVASPRTFVVQLQATATGTIYLQSSGGYIPLDARL